MTPTAVDEVVLAINRSPCWRPPHISQDALEAKVIGGAGDALSNNFCFHVIREGAGNQ